MWPPCRPTSATRATRPSGRCCWCGRTARPPPPPSSPRARRRRRPSSSDVQSRLFIGGEFVDALAGGAVGGRNPHDASPPGGGPTRGAGAEGRAPEGDRAVDAAQEAFPAWAATPAAERGRFLFRLADAIDAH